VQPRVGAFPEILAKTGGGLVVDPEDPDALADGILALRRDLALAESMGRAGAAGVAEHYTVERMADQVEAVYRELAADRVGVRQP
jgi:colanic acid biosynthesis glycosyl transferase WcaI